jgi:hypothetical protein
VSCDANGACPPVKGLKNGDQHTFQVKSVNSVGESRTAVQTAGWAFAQPVIGGVSAKPVFDGNITTATTGAFDLTIPNTDSTASAYTVQWSGNTQTVNVGGGDHTTVRLSAAAGQPTEVTVTPVSRFDQPPGDSVGASPTSTSVTPAGLPSVNGGGGLTATDDSITVTSPAQGVRNGSDKSDAYVYIAVPAGAAPQCSNSGGSATIDTSLPQGGRIGDGTTIHSLNQFQRYEVFVCYTNQYGVAMGDLGQQIVWDQSNAPTPSDCNYDITKQSATLPDFEYGRDGKPDCGSGSQQGVYSLQITGSDQDEFGAQPSFTARYCAFGGNDFCGAPKQVAAADGSAPYQLRVSAVAAMCTAQQSTDQGTGQTVTTLTGKITMQGQGVGQASIGIVAYTYVMPGATTPTAGQGNGVDATVTLPPGATQFRVTDYRINLPQGFGDPYAGGPVSPDPSCN